MAVHEFTKIHELPISLVVDNKYEPTDYLVSKNRIVSKKAFDIIKSLNKNIKGFESQMYFNGEKIWNIYYTLIFPKYEIMNLEKSEYETLISRVSRKEFISDIDKLIFDKKKLNKITEDNFFYNGRISSWNLLYRTRKTSHRRSRTYRICI